MTLPANIRVNVPAPFPATVKSGAGVTVFKQNGIWTVALNFGALATVVNLPNQASTYTIAWDSTTGVYYRMLLSTIAAFAAASQKKLTDAGPYAAQPADQVLIVAPAVPAPYVITVDWSTRSGRPLRVVDGNHNASVNSISITPALGQTQMGAVNYTYVIDGDGGSITLTPLADLSGAF